MLTRRFNLGVFNMIDKYKMANQIEQMNTLSESDISRLRRISDIILSDKICDVSEYESKRFLLPCDPLDESLLGRAKWAIKGRTEGTNKLFKLTLERTENKQIQEAFGIGQTLNPQLFWMFLHAWVLHKRMVAFNDGAQEEDYFEALFRVIDHWMLQKEIPRHKLTLEIANAQKHALGFCVGMDVAIERPEILGGRVLEMLHATFFDPTKIEKDHPYVVNLTKYAIRQASYAIQIPKHNFLTGNFIWIDYTEPEKKVQRRKKLFE
jgi:Ubiquinol-cytochrome C chaperone